MPLDPELDAMRAELSEAVRDLTWIESKTQPHIHLREEVAETWTAAFRRVRRVRDALGRRAHGVELEPRGSALERGTELEHREHPAFTRAQARQIAADHLREDPGYYDRG